MEPNAMFYDCTGSGKSNMATAKTEVLISQLVGPAAILDFRAQVAQLHSFKLFGARPSASFHLLVSEWKSRWWVTGSWSWRVPDHLCSWLLKPPEFILLNARSASNLKYPRSLQIKTKRVAANIYFDSFQKILLRPRKLVKHAVAATLMSGPKFLVKRLPSNSSIISLLSGGSRLALTWAHRGRSLQNFGWANFPF